MQYNVPDKKENTVRILGIDPGLQITGFGIIESDGRTSRIYTAEILKQK